MPTVDIEYPEFERMLGMDLHRDVERIDDILSFVKGEVKGFDEQKNVMIVEIKDTNRPDVWNLEGLVRALRGFLGLEVGLRHYSLEKPLIEVYVDKRLKNIRPYIGCAVVKNVQLNDAVIRGLMHLQDKLDQSYGRNRQRTSIGLYNFDLIKTPLHYGVAIPTEFKFVPLGFEEEMNLNQILQKHPKGLEYGHIVAKHQVYPILLDSDGHVLSFPPVINSNDLGRITDETRNVLVEVTGTMASTVLNTLNIVTLSLIDHHGKAYSAIIHYRDPNSPKGMKNTVITPNFDPKKARLSVDYVNKISGLKLKAKEIVSLLVKASFDVTESSGNELSVSVPCWRIDVMHPIDLVEEVTIAYGYNNMKPLWRKLATTSGIKPEQVFINVVRELMIGLGFQEILTYTMTNPESLFVKMGCPKERIVEISNPKVQTMTCLRNWLLPSLMEFLSSNLSVEFPQKVFEVGKVTVLNEKKETRTEDQEHLAAVISHASANFSEIKSALEAFLRNIGQNCQLKASKHQSFITGRAGTVAVNGNNVGTMGEVHPKVLNAWKIENPTVAFELNLNSLETLKASSDQNGDKPA